MKFLLRFSTEPVLKTATLFSSVLTVRRSSSTLGALRLKIGHSDFGKSHGLFEEGWKPLWVIDFPDVRIR